MLKSIVGFFAFCCIFGCEMGLECTALDTKEAIPAEQIVCVEGKATIQYWDGSAFDLTDDCVQLSQPADATAQQDDVTVCTSTK